MKFIAKFFFLIFLIIASKNIFGQVVLNELKIRPRGATNTPPNGLNLTGSEEYIELYNQGCTPLNVAGYYIAMRQDFNGRISGGTIRIPNIPQAVIPPKSHIVIAPATAAPVSDVDIVITVANVPYCTYNSSFVLPNVDGWAALYDASGTPIDAVYWTSAASNINTQPGDFGGTICLPTGSPVTSLFNLQQINTNFPGLVKYGGASFLNTTDTLLSRQTDGTGNWVRNLPSSITKSSPTKNCNAGTCFTPPPATTGFSYTTPSCNNGTISPTTVSGFTPGGTYTAPPGVVINSTTGEINLATSTVGGPYTITYTVTGGGCSAAGSGTAPITIQNCCPTITNPNTISPQCPAADLPPITVSTSTTGANAIKFVYFNAQQTVPNTIYAATNILGTATPSSGTVTYDGGNLGTAGSLPNNPGTYYVYAILNSTPTDPNCRPFVEIQLVVSSAPVAPTILSTPPTCLVAGSSTISNYDNTLTYTFSPTGPTAGVGGAITGMVVGITYTVTSRNANGCTSPASTSFSNLAQLTTPSAPLIQTAAPTCTSGGISTITNYNSSLNYTFTPIGPTVGTGGLISGMTVGISYTVIAGTTGCTSPASSPFSNLAQLTAPVAPTIQSTPPTCLADGSSTISNYDNTLTYTFSPTGPTVGAGGAISGMTIGTSYTLTATNGSGCTSPASNSFSNLAQLTTPVAPLIQTALPTCTSDGVSTITNYNNLLTYSFTPVGPTVGTGGAISGMTVGTSYTVIAGTTGCTSPASSPFSNLAQLTAPVVPTIQSTAPTCLAAGSSTISNYNSSLTYTFSPFGPIVGSLGAITGMTEGVSYTVTSSNASGCASPASNPFINVAQLSTPARPSGSVTTQPTCIAPNGIITISTPSGFNLEYSNDGLTYQTSNIFSLLTPNTTYNITVRNASTGCVSLPLALTVAPIPNVPASPAFSTIDPSCSSPLTGSLTVTSPLGPQYQYSINGLNYLSSTQFAGLVPNTYNVTVRETATGCTSSPSVATILPPPPVSPLPTAPAQPAYCVGDVPLGPVAASGTNLLWYSGPSGGTGSTSAPTPTTSTFGQQIFYVTQTIPPNGCESGRLPVVVNINPLPTVSAGPDRRINVGESVVLQGVALGNGVDILWSPNNNLSNPKIPRPTASPLINITYNITVVTADGCVGSDDVTVVVLQPIDIPNVFSPNGDGFNDLWIIDKLEQYPNSVVEVFNRYGGKIFERKGYNRSNAWDGTNKGAPLPVGPYYYILRLGDNTKARAGVVSIIR